MDAELSGSENDWRGPEEKEILTRLLWELHLMPQISAREDRLESPYPRKHCANRKYKYRDRPGIRRRIGRKFRGFRRHWPLFLREQLCLGHVRGWIIERNLIPNTP